MLIRGVMLLPEGWTFEEHEVYGVVIRANNDRDAVSIDVRQRGFVLGVAAVPRGLYYGRDWKKRLYRDAVTALRKTVEKDM